MWVSHTQYTIADRKLGVEILQWGYFTGKLWERRKTSKMLILEISPLIISIACKRQSHRLSFFRDSGGFTSFRYSQILSIPITSHNLRQISDIGMLSSFNRFQKTTRCWTVRNWTVIRIPNAMIVCLRILQIKYYDLVKNSSLLTKSNRKKSP